MYNKSELKEELEHISTHYDFSTDCSPEIIDLVLKNSLASYDEDGILFLTSSGEKTIGWNDGYGTAEPEEDYTEVFFLDEGANDYE